MHATRQVRFSQITLYVVIQDPRQMQPTLHLPSCLFAMPDLAPPAPYAAKFIRPYDTKERKETMVVPWEEDRMSLLLLLRRRLGFAGWPPRSQNFASCCSAWTCRKTASARPASGRWPRGRAYSAGWPVRLASRSKAALSLGSRIPAATSRRLSAPTWLTWRTGRARVATPGLGCSFNCRRVRPTNSGACCSSRKSA